PRRWRGALLPAGTQIGLRTLEPDHRPVSATADFHEVRDAVKIGVRQARERAITLLFDPERSLAQRILDEQFELWAIDPASAMAKCTPQPAAGLTCSFW